MEEKYYTIREIAELTGLHVNTVRGYVKAGRLPSIKVRGKYGDEYRIREHDLYHSGIPSFNERLGPQMVEMRGGMEEPGQIAMAEPSQVVGDTDRVEEAVDIKELIDRLEEANRKLGGYEQATLALREAQDEASRYRTKWLDTEEDLMRVKRELSELRDELYSTKSSWYKRRKSKRRYTKGI